MYWPEAAARGRSRLGDLLLRARSEEGHAAYTSQMDGVAIRPRAYVGVRGPDAEDFLQRMVSNDVSSGVVRGAAPDPEGARDRAAHRLAPGEDDFLLLTEPELGDVVLRAPHAHALARAGGDRAGGAHVARRARR